MEALWEAWGPTVRAASLPAEDFHRPPQNVNLRADRNLTDWMTRTWDFVSPRLVRSVLNADASSSSWAPLLTILDRKRADPLHAPPLHVLVFGGSPTAGHGCISNPFVSLGRGGNLAFPTCAWSARLQDMMNAVLGPGTVVVRNAAGGGTTSDISAILIEYGLLWSTTSEKNPPPDVMINGHAINDAITLFRQPNQMLAVRQAFQVAARESRCGGLPVIIHLDDFVADPSIALMSQTVTMADIIHQVTSWHGSQGVSYANVVRSHILSQFVNTSTYYDIWGSILNRHPGLMFHVGIAWTLLYNILLSMSRTCCVARSPPPHETPTAVEDPPVDIPLVNTSLTLSQVAHVWKRNTQERAARCAHNTTGDVCSYSWMRHNVAGIVNAPLLMRELTPYLTSNQNWKPAGYPIRSPKLGWDAQATNATFELSVPVTSRGAKAFTLVFMQSYGEVWKNSTLHGSLHVDGWANPFEFSVSGYHEQHTSVAVTSKFTIPTIHEGERATMKFQLLSGSTFKILGMALCAR
jgi:hypothetical protein